MEKRHRLRKNKDFKYTYKRGRKLGHPLFVLVYRRTNNSSLRIGFSITKKFGPAVKRNRIKRQLREIVSADIENIRHGHDIIFSLRKGAGESTFEELESAVSNLLKRAKLYKKGVS
ncbi:MAG TPA: ribonuclease P protein component [Bacillota bacterium]|nr:ribonuclease P protein component [Bacillota bacterium]